MGGGRPAWAAPRRLGHARRPPGPTGGSGGSSFEINPVVCPVRRPASAHGTLRWCSWRAAVRAYPPPLAQPQPALTHDRLTGRCRPTDGSEQVDDGSGSANLSTILAGCRGTARVRAVHTALPAWLILLRGLTDACLPARALAAKMGMLWPRATISLIGAPIRLHLLSSSQRCHLAIRPCACC